MNQLLQYPLDSARILQKRKSLKKELEKGEKLEVRVAVLGGETTATIKDILELFLLDSGIKPVFYESEYNKWYEDAVFENEELQKFSPQIVLVTTFFSNIVNLPSVLDSEEGIDKKLNAEINKICDVWKALLNKYDTVIIQNNFALPERTCIGNLSSCSPAGYVSFVNRLNSKIVEQAKIHKNVYINDVNYLAAKIGLTSWYDMNSYYLYKMPMSFDAAAEYCYNLSRIILAIYSKIKKCVVLDLDNTLWGGVIGDDGLQGIKLGKESALGEAYQDFQRYLLNLKERGVILAVCSKNDEDIAKEGFSHPDSVLKVDDFAAFYANWEPKHNNIVNIAKHINIGIDSLVFIDDNPVERKIVRDNLPSVAVPEVIGEDPYSYIRAIEDGRYFETVNISADDLKRNDDYRANNHRAELEKSFGSYEDFLRSLEMKAVVEPFSELYIDRITQLTNKTNQFNVTTKRYTKADIEKVMHSDDYMTFYCRLKDKFSDNGIISLVIGKKTDADLHIELWLMSCRVLKRTVEQLLFNKVLEYAKRHNINKIYGYYYETPKNKMVRHLYTSLGFTECGDGITSVLDVAKAGMIDNVHIEVTQDEQ